MGNPNILSKEVRRKIIEDINSEENKSRKRESQRRFDVYQKRQDRYILEKLGNEFNPDTVREMRKVLSISLSEKIIKEKSSVYQRPPDRTFVNADEKEQEQLENLYEYGWFNSKMKLVNKYYNLFDFNNAAILPKDGVIQTIPMTPMSYDVVPDADDPEKAFAFILNIMDLGTTATYRNYSQLNRGETSYNDRDYANQITADDDDRLGLVGKYIVWTDDYHFTMDESGNFVGGPIENPIKALPFLDVAVEKDNQYFVRRGSSLTEFCIEFAVALSDLANIIKLQGYAQAVVVSEKMPKNFKVGPNHSLWLQQTKKGEKDPSFSFVSPSPDIANSLSFLESLLSVFLSSEGIDPKTITTDMQSTSFSSGIERLLALIEKFEASEDDLDLFKYIEKDAFSLFVAWSNELQGVKDGPAALIDELNISTISDDVYLEVQFKGPEAVKTDSDKLDYVEKRMELGLMSKKGALMFLDGVDQDAATEELARISEDEVVTISVPAIPDVPSLNTEDEEIDGSTDV